jgi:hypothetical protein
MMVGINIRRMDSGADVRGFAPKAMGRGGLEVRIDVGSGPRVLDGVIRECLVIYSITTLFTPRERVNKILNFSHPILRKSFDFLH